MKRQLNVFDNKVYGYEISDYGLKNGYLDYYTLSKIVGDAVLNNNIFEYAGYENWEFVNGEEENEDGDYYEVYQYYIIGDYGYRFLRDYTDEIVYYHEDLDMYLWGITHFGTSWDYVLTDIKIDTGKEDEPVEEDYWFLKSEPKYRYMLLSRMKQDCEYYFDNGNKNPKHLCAGDEKDQIAEMKALWNSFSEEDKPEWLTWKEILEYEKRMKVKE